MCFSMCGSSLRKITVLLFVASASIFASGNDGINIPPIDTLNPIDTTTQRGDSVIVKGLVKDSSGVPAKDCNVVVYLIGTGMGFSNGTAVTDASGAYEVKLFNRGAANTVNVVVTLNLNSGTGSGSIQNPSDGITDIVTVDIIMGFFGQINNRVVSLQRVFNSKKISSRFTINGSKIAGNNINNRSLSTGVLIIKDAYRTVSGLSIEK